MGMMGELPAMAELARYSAIEALRDGRCVEIRAVERDDGDRLVESFAAPARSRCIGRFFAVRRITEREIAFFSNVDFVNHVALVAVMEEAGRPMIVGVDATSSCSRASRDRFRRGRSIPGPRSRRGVDAPSYRIAREGGLKELIAEVLPENAPMLKVSRKVDCD